VTVADLHTYLRTLLAGIATAPAIDTGVRHDLLTDVLAPLGCADADRAARQIEQHAYWIRYRKPRRRRLARRGPGHRGRRRV
jgi:hypothetical protein